MKKFIEYLTNKLCKRNKNVVIIRHKKEIEHVSKDVAYEVKNMIAQCQMFNKLNITGFYTEFDLIKNGENLIKEDRFYYTQSISNSVMESSLVKVRNIGEFLFKSKGNSYYIRAHHYFDDPNKWLNIKNDFLRKNRSEFNTVFNHISSVVAHLSYERGIINYEKMRLSINKIFSWNLEYLQIFFELKPDYFKSDETDISSEGMLQFISDRIDTFK